MYLAEDTRNQVGKHKNIQQYCKRHGIKMIRQKLDNGDYMLFTDEGEPYTQITVDTKQDLMELCKDVMSNDHRRFRDCCIRAKEAGVQLIILVEEMPPYGNVAMWEVPRWQSSNEWHRFGDPMTLVEPVTFSKALQTMTEKYGVKFRFCHRKQTANKVIKYLKGELK